MQAGNPDSSRGPSRIFDASKKRLGSDQRRMGSQETRAIPHPNLGALRISRRSATRLARPGLEVSKAENPQTSPAGKLPRLTCSVPPLSGTRFTRRTCIPRPPISTAHLTRAGTCVNSLLPPPAARSPLRHSFQLSPKPFANEIAAAYPQAHADLRVVHV